MLGRFTAAVLAIASIASAQGLSGQSLPDRPPQTASTAHGAIIVLPAGTSIPLGLTAPIWTKTAKVGDGVYAQTVFPVVVGSQVAIPPGTYVGGLIDSLARPGLLSPHARLQISFANIVFRNGYVVELPNPPAHAGVANDVIPAVAQPFIEVSRASEVLLDNGSQIDMILQLPLALDAAKVEAAARQTSPASTPAQSAVVCHPIPGTPGTPGTPDTVIPGTPGTPGTPDIVVPGAPGTPGTVIPGIPATPGTPDTAIPGTPGTPGTPEIPCPAPPVVVPHEKEQTYKQTFELDASAELNGKLLPAGRYTAVWTGLGPSAQVQILGSGITMEVQARVVILNKVAASGTPDVRTNPDGSRSLESVRFAGQSFALYFD